MDKKKKRKKKKKKKKKKSWMPTPPAEPKLKRGCGVQQAGRDTLLPEDDLGFPAYLHMRRGFIGNATGG